MPNTDTEDFFRAVEAFLITTFKAQELEGVWFIWARPDQCPAELQTITKMKKLQESGSRMQARFSVRILNSFR